jgi:hypothetical protein
MRVYIFNRLLINIPVFTYTLPFLRVRKYGFMIIFVENECFFKQLTVQNIMQNSDEFSQVKMCANSFYKFY